MTTQQRCVAMLVAVMALLSGGAHAQGPQLNQVMRTKLLHAQQTLEAVVTADWTGLERHARELERLTQSPGWMVLQYPEYRAQSQAFVTSLQALQRVAGERDSVRATDAYTAVVRQCVACHQYVARARIAR